MYTCDTLLITNILSNKYLPNHYSFKKKEREGKTRIHKPRIYKFEGKIFKIRGRGVQLRG